MEEKRVLGFGDYETPLLFIHIDKRGSYVLNKPQQGIIPHIAVYAETVPAAWELAMLSCWDYGSRVGTHYDKTEETPRSKEGTITLKIMNPSNEPRIHKNFPGGPEELEVYRQEVVLGIHDHWINPKEGKWTYTYHDRLFNYNPSSDLRKGDAGKLLSEGINQIEDIMEELERDITSRAAQATTWIPGADIKLPGDRPCLQRLWARLLPISESDENKGYLLNMNTYWRSRDLAKAWIMNVYALTDLQKVIAEKLEQKINVPIKVGSYFDGSDSLHIYGDYFKEIQVEFEKMRDDDLSKRVWVSDHPAFVFMTKEAKEKLAKDPEWYAKGDLR